MTILDYLRIWLAGARYSIVRTLMFRFDFIMWSLVELFWMVVNVLLVAVIYEHTESIAGWKRYEMLLLVGSSMLVQRFIMGFVWSNLFEMARNIRSGHFDFFLAQPGKPLVMVSTRKVDLDGLANAVVAAAVVIYAARQLGLSPSFVEVALYALMLLCGFLINYAILLITVSLTFWLGSAQGIEGSYFTLMEFSRLPRQAFKGVSSIVFVWILPAVVVSNVPANTLIHGFEPLNTLWLLAVTIAWMGLAVWVFNRGLRRYASASS
ncbi:MAG: ABC-2 family transporter protein [Opitutus sp.]|nr:ABC-2 family transporter protein [Opitutus sp.]MCS6275571.1 ABC-2 family transporter protein [Opitutus sp.]MCS6275722.1 ABC-2 family transporter protein [Opitutus sp.]MCS6300818.1 ABC-2 family transporter protein [Opitutus sp.]